MDNVISILQPCTAVDENKELLLELLKAERKANKERIESQRRRIVELTAAHNELLATVDGVNQDDVKEHILDLEENAKKMAKTLEAYEQSVRERDSTIVQKDVLIGGLQKKVAELTKTIESMKCEVKEDSKTLVEIFSDMADDALAIGVDVNEITMDDSECPYGTKQDKKTTAVVGGHYCRKKCPFFEGMDKDRKLVKCTKNKLV